MRIRVFRAPNLAEAMAQVRDELGLDALILETTNRSGIVEVTAALDPEDEPGSADSLFPNDLDPVLPQTVAVAPGTDPLLRHNLPPSLLSALRDGPLDAACSRLFRFSRLPLDADGPPLMLVGPPGGGKTLSIAKLATRLVLEGHHPLVITADEQRAGAVEQLAAFTRLLGLTLVAAGRPEMLARTLARRDGNVPVLIDAPGLDLTQAGETTLQRELLAAAEANAALVLPAGLDALEATEVAGLHAGNGIQRLVPTRIDRTGRLGGILAACHAADLALAEAGTGTDVAEGLTRLTPATLAARLSAEIPGAGPPPVATAPAPEVQPTLARSDALSLHISAQASGHRAPFWKTHP